MATPTDDQALQFCIMLQAGLPAEEAIAYFGDFPDRNALLSELAQWQKSRNVRLAMRKVLGKAWQDMSLDEKIHAALNQHYASLAYLLFSTNYVSAGQQEKAKLDSARQALEAKVAGTAGKGDALSRFFDDLQSGRVKLPGAPVALPVRAS